MSEGFDEIVRVQCVPEFEGANAQHKQLYEQHLVEK